MPSKKPTREKKHFTLFFHDDFLIYATLNTIQNQRENIMRGPFGYLREIWEKTVRQLCAKKESPKNLFGHRYDKMLELQAGLSPFEKNQMNLYIALKEIDGAVRHYPDYLREASAFFELRLGKPDSPASLEMDLNRVAHFKIALDLLIASASSAGKDYMDRVRAEMPVPLTPDIRKRALELERQSLLAEIATLRGPKVGN